MEMWGSVVRKGCGMFVSASCVAAVLLSLSHVVIGSDLALARGKADFLPEKYGTGYVCRKTLVTLYSRKHFHGPAYSIRCSATDLRFMACLPVQSIAVKAGTSVFFFPEPNYGGKPILVRQNVPDVSKVEGLLAAQGSMRVCKEPVHHATDNCTAGTELHTCEEIKPNSFTPLDENYAELRVPVKHVGDFKAPTVEEMEERMRQKFFLAHNEEFVGKLHIPDPKWHNTTGPEPCFYKSYIREAYLGCMPQAWDSFVSLTREFMPKYRGIARWVDPDPVARASNPLSGSEYIFIDNVLYGLVNPSWFELDAGSPGCSRCGLRPKRYQVLKRRNQGGILSTVGQGTIKVVTPEQVEKSLEERPQEARRQIMHELGDFLDDGVIRYDMARSFVTQLTRLGELLEATNEFTFVDTSLLLVYGYNPALKIYEARVKMLDFANTVNTPGTTDLLPEVFYAPLPGEHKGAVYRLWGPRNAVGQPAAASHNASQHNADRGSKLTQRSLLCGVGELRAHLRSLLLDKFLPNECLLSCSGCGKAQTAAYRSWVRQSRARGDVSAVDDVVAPRADALPSTSGVDGKPFEDG
eukprot:jgi/Mesvir1/16534/Mv10078-RA.1